MNTTPNVALLLQEHIGPDADDFIAFGIAQTSLELIRTYRVVRTYPNACSDCAALLRRQLDTIIEEASTLRNRLSPEAARQGGREGGRKA